MLALAALGCASAPPRGAGAGRAMWERGCFSHIAPDPRERESSRLEGSVYTAGYGRAEFPIPAAVVYVRRRPDGEVTTVDVDQDGRFAVADAPEGLYDLGVCANGWTAWRGTLRIRRGAPTGALDVPLELGP